jgi:hypothetical protein
MGANSCARPAARDPRSQLLRTASRMQPQRIILDIVILGTYATRLPARLYDGLGCCRATSALALRAFM